VLLFFFFFSCENVPFSIFEPPALKVLDEGQSDAAKRMEDGGPAGGQYVSDVLLYARSKFPAIIGDLSCQHKHTHTPKKERTI
jgi:hypothetical protein